MSDIFVSYASADREKARALADALTARGWSVWWDRTIPPGKEFDQVIEEALDSAKCVVVLWSRISTTSSWVKTEAADAMRRKILVPALIDDTKIPLEFRRLQAADLSDWEGQPGHEEFDHFCQSVEANLKGRREPLVPPPLPRPRAPRPKPVESVGPVSSEPAPASQASRGRMMLVGIAAGVVVTALAGFLGLEYSKRAELERQLSDQQRQRPDVRTDENAGPRDENAGPRDAARRASDTPQAPPAQQPQSAGDAERTEDLRQARAARQRQEQASIPLEDRADSAPAPRAVDLEWNDASLRYSGTLTWTRDEAMLRFTAFDGPTGTELGDFTFPARPPARQSTYTITGVVPVIFDSTTPVPHQHNVNLRFEVESGIPRLIENCQTPDNCFPAP